MSDDGSVNTVNTATVKNQFTFSHLFPAHLYIKNSEERTAGQEIDHDEEDLNKAEEAAKPILMLNNESKVFIGQDTTETSYERMPVDNFGKNVLTKLGWQGDGYGIGKNKEKASQIIEYIPRQHRLGLGAQALSKDQLKKQGANSDRRQFAVTQNFEASSVGRNFKPIDEQLEVKSVMSVGSKVIIIGGSHKGLEGKVIAMTKKKTADHGMSMKNQ